MLMDIVPYEHLVIKHIQLLLVPLKLTLRSNLNKEKGHHTFLRPASQQLASHFQTPCEVTEWDIFLANMFDSTDFTLTITPVNEYD